VRKWEREKETETGRERGEGIETNGEREEGTDRKGEKQERRNEWRERNGDWGREREEGREWPNSLILLGKLSSTSLNHETINRKEQESNRGDFWYLTSHLTAAADSPSL
jgi:hypothetical protein